MLDPNPVPNAPPPNARPSAPAGAWSRAPARAQPPPTSIHRIPLRHPAHPLTALLSFATPAPLSAVRDSNPYSLPLSPPGHLSFTTPTHLPTYPPTDKLTLTPTPFAPADPPFLPPSRPALVCPLTPHPSAILAPCNATWLHATWRMPPTPSPPLPTPCTFVHPPCIAAAATRGARAWRPTRSVPPPAQQCSGPCRPAACWPARWPADLAKRNTFS